MSAAGVLSGADAFADELLFLAEIEWEPERYFLPITAPTPPPAPHTLSPTCCSAASRRRARAIDLDSGNLVDLPESPAGSNVEVRLPVPTTLQFGAGE